MFGKTPPPSQPTPAPPEPEPPELDGDFERKLSLLEETAAWRAVGLLERGFTLEQVLVLVRKADIVHSADYLLAKGCPVDTAFDLLSD